MTETDFDRSEGIGSPSRPLLQRLDRFRVQACAARFTVGADSRARPNAARGAGRRATDRPVSPDSTPAPTLIGAEADSDAHPVRLFVATPRRDVGAGGRRQFPARACAGQPSVRKGRQRESRSRLRPGRSKPRNQRAPRRQAPEPAERPDLPCTTFPSRDAGPRASESGLSGRPRLASNDRAATKARAGRLAN